MVAVKQNNKANKYVNPQYQNICQIKPICFDAIAQNNISSELADKTLVNLYGKRKRDNNRDDDCDDNGKRSKNLVNESLVNHQLTIVVLCHFHLFIKKLNIRSFIIYTYYHFRKKMKL